MSHERHTISSDDRREIENIEKSLNVTTYLNEVYEAIHSGKPAKVHVPDFRSPTRGEVNSAVSSESQGISMDLNAFADAVSGDQIKTAQSDESPTRTTPGPKNVSTPRFTVSRNQAIAIKKYPTLIEFLGRAEGEKIARKIAGDMNVMMSELITANSKEANKWAVVCKADKQNLRQYFQGEDWNRKGKFTERTDIYYCYNCCNFCLNFFDTSNLCLNNLDKSENHGIKLYIL